jgi:hypothetical protein
MRGHPRHGRVRALAGMPCAAGSGRGRGQWVREPQSLPTQDFFCQEALTPLLRK